MIDKSRRQIATWLLSGCFLVFLMVWIGGITRLTGSGLSITEWKPIMGAIPPLNERDWNEAFSKYQQIPQFQKVNSTFTLSEFKSIFWWEYIHRLVGRLIGVVFIVPFLFFYFRKQLDDVLVRKVMLLFLLGGIQGFLGWFMVKSGLSERTSVSHYRLAIHLLAAFTTFGFTFWFALELLSAPNLNQSRTNDIWRKRSTFLFALIFLQITYGAFVAGLHAGKMYNTFPLMDGQIIPSGILSLSPTWINLFDNPVCVQFIHRLFAFIIFFYIVFLAWKSRNELTDAVQKKSVSYLFSTVMLQVVLGIITIISSAQIAIASIHQLGAFLLFAASVFAMFRFRKNRSVQ